MYIHQIKLQKEYLLRILCTASAKTSKLQWLFTQESTSNLEEKLSDTVKKLPDMTFIQIHKSYLINLNYISEYSADKIKMTDGTVLGISPSKKKEVKVKFMQYELL